MASFDYVALDLAGRTRTGSLKAPDEAAARETLERRRLAPVKVSPGAARPSSAAPVLGGRLDTRQLALVTRQLATLIAVAPLEESLRTIAAQAEKPAVRRALNAVHAGVLEGYRLSDAMGREGRAFPPLYRAMVAAGESSGSLPSILERLADLLERDQEAQSKVTAALIYPAVLAVTALLVVLALMTFVVPKVVDQFESMGQTLPLLTRVVIGASDAVRSYGLVILALLVIAGFGAAQALRRPEIRLRADAALLRLPLIGRLIRDLHAARLARTLSTMIASGLPILEGLLITAPTVHNRVLRQATLDMAEMIREGGSLSAAMRKVGVFPPLLVYMAASGENSGRVDLMLGRAAEYLEREFATFTAVALSLLEPAIIVLMGGLVAVIVLSILLPILQINTLAFG
ncbi:MAG: type II secretion system inner membrane protein GspF [Phenylobacterium sp.]|uniref:type II secretion system inner membrane protein GspF n=1 Tax=Phenylobacterium sp. TaxID=1871053 RepID=UPI001816034A|nr:type II secretion system inner membrane protein GspF [Phenylobacterium sp.]MBA4794229.1 type II secretion system inner membrane protein GspF [Phenylobacterium sp.]